MVIKPHFVKFASYWNTESTGEIQGVDRLAQLDIEGKNVLLVEDMIDTGTTMRAVLAKMRSNFQLKSLRVAVAFHKKTQKNKDKSYFADYTGFMVEDDFLIGQGLDYNGYFRDIDHVCRINDRGIRDFANGGPGQLAMLKSQSQS